MSVLSTIRHNMLLVVVVIGISILGFIATDFLSSLGGAIGGPSDAGIVAGESISREEFAQRYQNLSNQYGNLPESQRGFVIDQTWNDMVSEIVYNNEFENVGLVVSGDEVYDMFTGKNIHPQVQSIPAFQREGVFDPALARDYLENTLTATPEQQQAVRQLEDFLVRSRATEQYNYLVKSGYIGSKALARQQYIDQNKKIDISFLAINYTQVPDSVIQVRDSDLKSYISDNPKRYKQEDEVFAKYVKFPIEASAADSARAIESLMKLKAKFATTPSDSAFTVNKTRTPYTANFQPVSGLPAGLKDSISNSSSAGDIYGPILEGNFYKLYKIVAIENGDDTEININHILITPEGITKADTAEARSKAASLARQANRSNFFDLANENSRDFATKTKGGKLGWYTKGSFGEDFDNAVDRMAVGQIRGPIKSNRGFHVVQVVEKTKRTYAVANVEKEVYAGSETIRNRFQVANQFLLASTRSGSIDSAAVQEGQNAIQTNALAPATRNVVGLQGGRDLVLWALESDIGAFSEVLEIGENYVCAQVTSKKSEGLRSVEDVRIEVSQKVRNEKKAEYIINKLNSMTLGDDLNVIKDEYGGGAFVSSSAGITFESNNVAGIGNDYLVVGKIMGMEEGQVSAPIAGNNGVYIIKVDKVTEAIELEDETLATKRDTDVISGQNTVQTKIQQVLTKMGNVEDNRHKIGY